jgi:hemerythrin-like metal-binding protein
MDKADYGSELGIEIIDRDHREISELLVEININTERDGDADRKVRRLGDLARVTRSHFLLEEWMMAATNYPGLAPHRTRHAWMLEEILRLAEYWGKKKNVLTREPMGLLWESHIEHVECEDQAYGLWLGRTRGESERNRAFFPMKP